MSYKIDSEKGFKILRCISPPIIFVNGPFGVGKSAFVNKFKKEGFSVLNINDISGTENQIENVQKYLKNRKDKSFDHNPVIIEANISDEKLISDIFNGEFHNFTYVFVYPNNSKKYKENLTLKINSGDTDHIQLPNERIKQMIEELKMNSKNAKDDKNDKNDDKDNKENKTKDRLLTKLTVELINLNKKIYQNHLETFDDKILTILI